MATPSLTASPASAASGRPALDKKTGPFTYVIFFAVLAMGMLFTAYSLMHDMHELGTVVTTWTPFLLLGVALLIALGFEFVNGFHDTANAIATVIYTHSLPPNVAVVWSGFFNFLGVLLSSGAVAFGIIALLPVEPASSSHTLIGSIIGVGVANALMHGRDGTSGVDWAQATKIGYALLLSPLVGFGFAALLLLALRAFVKNRSLYKAPEGNTPPPWWIRGLLIATCTGVSFAHGSNDGQKGMGLIMLILVGTLPMAYALNRTMPADQALQFAAVAEVTQQALVKSAPLPAPADPRPVLSDYVRSKQATPQLIPALAALTGHIGEEVKGYGSLSKVPAEAMGNVRNDMYLASESIRLMDKNKVGNFDADTSSKLQLFKQQIDNATRFIPLWVKIAVAIALGLGTMVGWKRIVVTVGEKIGKTHLTYAQGASAKTVAMLTIGAADMFGLPVSTTHVLSSGVAGTMVANGGGLQMKTIRNLLMAWVLTLPAAILLSGSLYWLFTQIF